jgi:hypothetical protein
MQQPLPRAVEAAESSYSSPVAWWVSCLLLRGGARGSLGASVVLSLCDEGGLGVAVAAACTASAPPPIARTAGTVRIASFRFKLTLRTR